MEKLYAYRQQLRSHITRLKEELEKGNNITVPSDDDDLHELFSILQKLKASQNLYDREEDPENENSEAACWTWNPDSNCMNVSESLLKLFGIEGQALNTKLDEILKPVFHSDREKVENALLQAFKEQKPLNLYYRITTGDNTMRFVHSRAKVLKNTSGEPQMLSGIVTDVTEQVLEEKKYHILLETSPDAIITTDENGVIKDWNHKSYEYFGWLHSEVVGKNFADLLLTEKHRKEFHETIRHYLSTRDAKLINRKSEVNAIRQDGTIFPADLTMSAVKLESSHLLLHFIRDISEQKIGENLLREKDELYRTVVESLFEGLIITDTTDRITYVNSQFERLSGYSRHELIGKIEYEVFHGISMHESIRNRMRNRLAGQCETYELVFLRKDKSTFTGRVNAAPYKNACGDIIGTVAAITDITAQKRKDELEQLVIAATKSFNSVMIMDKQGLIEWTNEGFIKLTGYTQDDVKGTRGEILRRSEQSGLANQTQLIEEVQKRKEPITFESKSYTKEGREFWTITTFTPVLNEQNEVEKIISIDSDITLRRKMEEQLKLANKIAENSLIKGNRALSELTLAKQTLEETMRAKEQFLAHISHEIRTPMNGIIGLTDLLLKSELTQEQKEYLQAIKTSGDTLMVVINDILDLSKIEAGKMTFEEIPLRIDTVISPILDLFSPKTREKKIQLIKNISTSIPSILLGDPVRLNQIVMNLVSNAVKFTEKGSIEISATLKNETEDLTEIIIKVKDSGPGIPKEKLHTLFLDFTQASTDITRKYGGSGLGLSIAKRLVELQGGSVAVESVIDEGSEFTITLPFKKPSESLQFNRIEDKDEPKEPGNLNGANVLLVEDNPVNQLLAEKLLSDWGCNISTADNGRIAIEKLERNSYDIILMDIKMPEMDGYEATKWIRQMDNRVKNIPIIAITAHAAIWEAEKCIEAGMNGYISKPFNIKELYRMIAGNLNTNPESGKNESTGKSFDPNHRYTDLTFLKSIAKGSTEFMNKIINSFINQTSDEIKNLQIYLARKDWTALHGSAHKIKPSLHFVGITELKEPIASLEKFAKERVNLEAVPALVQKVTDVCTKAISELRQELETMNEKKRND